MRPIFLTLICCLFFCKSGFSQEGNRYDIKIQIEGLSDSIAYLGYHFGEKRYYQDTSKISPNGEMQFVGDTTLKKGVYFIYSNGYYLEFLVKGQIFSLSSTSQDVYQNMKIEGSPENEIFRKFQLIMKKHQQSMRDLNAELKNASNRTDSTAVYEKSRSLGDANESRRDSLKKAYPESYTAVLLHIMQRPERNTSSGSTAEENKKYYFEYKEHFLDGIDFNDEGTLRVPVFHGRVMEYMERVTFQHPDSVVKSIDYILGLSKDNEEMMRYWTVFFFQHYQNTKVMGLDKAFYHIAENYYLKGKAPWASTETLEKLEEEMDFHRENQMGMLAPRLYLLDTLLDPLILREIQAEYTVLYFYRPSCGHCKKASPVLLDTYHNLQPDGVEVLGVNVDTDIEEWKEFIDELQLDWINAADPFTRSNFRRQFNVRSTPTLYILDKEKRIIAKKLGVEQVEGFIKDRMAFDKRRAENQN